MSWFKRIPLPHLAIVVMLLALVAGVLAPIHHDEGVFLTIGKRMSLGESPYQDYFDHKPPGIYWVGSSLMALTGVSIWSVRVVSVLVLVATGWLLINLLNDLIDKRMAWWLGITYVVLALWYQGNFFMTEAFVNLTGILALWLVSKKRSFFWSGLGSVIPALFKQTGLLYLFGLGLILWKLAKTGKVKREQGFSFVAGLTVSVIGLWVWLRLHNLLPVFFEQVVVFPLTNYPPYPLIDTLHKVGSIILPGMIWWGLAAVAWWRGGQRSPLLLGVKWMGAGLMPVLFYRPYHHYWLQMLPLGLILIGVNFGHKKWWQRWQPFLVTGVAGWFVLSYTGIGQYYLTDQLDYLGSLSCKEIDHPAGYFVTDCVPNKYFYTIDSR